MDKLLEAMAVVRPDGLAHLKMAPLRVNLKDLRIRGNKLGGSAWDYLYINCEQQLGKHYMGFGHSYQFIQQQVLPFDKVDKPKLLNLCKTPGYVLKPSAIFLGHQD